MHHFTPPINFVYVYCWKFIMLIQQMKLMMTVVNVPSVSSTPPIGEDILTCFVVCEFSLSCSFMFPLSLSFRSNCSNLLSLTTIPLSVVSLTTKKKNPMTYYPRSFLFASFLFGLSCFVFFIITPFQSTLVSKENPF